MAKLAPRPSAGEGQRQACAGRRVVVPLPPLPAVASHFSSTETRTDYNSSSSGAYWVPDSWLHSRRSAVTNVAPSASASDTYIAS